MIVPVTNFTQVPASSKQEPVQTANKHVHSQPLKRVTLIMDDVECTSNMAAMGEVSKITQQEEPNRLSLVSAIHDTDDSKEDSTNFAEKNNFCND